MNFKLSLTFLSLFYLFFLSSCANYYYSPNDGDQVMLRKKHDVHVAANYNFGPKNEIRTANIQAGYSPINHLAVAGSYFKTSDGKSDDRHGNGYILNGAIGSYYFLPFETSFSSKYKKTSQMKYNMENGLLFDCYLGSGKGKVNNFYKEGGWSIFQFRKNYFQIGLHLIKNYWGFSYNVRKGRLLYDQGQVFNQLKIGEEDLQKFRDLQLNNSFNLTEQSFVIHAGIKHIRYFISITSLTHGAKLQQLGAKNKNYNIGLLIEIDEFFRKRKD